VRSVVTAPDNDTGRRGNVLASILDWLTAGYPEGVPPQDRFPLLALMRSRLTDEQIRAVAERMISQSGEPSKTDAQVLITKVIDELPSEEEVERVRRHLEAAGIDLDWDKPQAGAA